MKILHNFGALRLLQSGALVEAVLRSVPSEEPGKKHPKQPSKEVRLQFLIDTGADHSSIQERVATALDLIPLRREPIFVGISSMVDCPIYRASLFLLFANEKNQEVEVQVPLIADLIGMPDPPEVIEYSGLLGRDVLAFFDFVYRGRSGEFELSF